MYTDEDAVEIKIEDDGNDMTECSWDDKPSLGTFFFLCFVCILYIHML